MAEGPPPKGAGSKEVSGEADGVTLSQCLTDGRVPAEEVALWRATMEELYGKDEADEADEVEEDDLSCGWALQRLLLRLLLWFLWVPRGR